MILFVKKIFLAAGATQFRIGALACRSIKGVNQMKWIYALLCLLGLVLPYYFFAPFALQHGLDLRLLVGQLFANPVSSFFGTDVIISSLALWAFIYRETRRRRVRLWWLAVLASLTVGVSLGLPLFLLLREIEMEKSQVVSYRD